ncbi:NACHT domain-containing protein [Lentzea sp. NPDC004789]
MIFINYRTGDGDFAAVLVDRELAAVFGSEHVFLASRSIPPGVDFDKEIESRLADCVVVLAVIGNRWLEACDEHGVPRLDLDDDWVRRELVLARRLGITVIPVFLDSTPRLAAARLPEDLRGLEAAQYCRLRHRNAEDDLAVITRQVGTLMTATERDLRQYLVALADRLRGVGDWLPYRSLEDGFHERRVEVHDEVPEHRPTVVEGEVRWRDAVRGVRLGVVLADAGFGKTWLLRRHGLQLCETALAALDAGAPLDDAEVPLFAHAHELAETWRSTPSPEAVARAALQWSPELRDNVRLRTHLAGRLSSASARAHVLVDAYDEVFDDGSRDAVAEALAHLAGLVRGRGGPTVLLTSRPAGFSDPFAAVGQDDDEPGTLFFELGVLSERQVRALWERWYELNGAEVPLARLDPVLAPLSAIRAAAGIPLVAAFCAWVAETEEVTTNRSGLYRQVVERFHRLEWKRGSPSPFPALRQDAGLRGRFRTAFRELGWHMATDRPAWCDAVPVDECESVLDRALGSVPTQRSRVFAATRAFGLLVPWGGDDAAPIGWIHRSVHQFVVAEKLVTLPPSDVEVLVAGRAWACPEWTDVLDFALGLEAAGDTGGGVVTEVVRRLACGGADGLGWFATAFVAAGAGFRAGSAARTEVTERVWRLYGAGFLSAEHLARVLALTPSADPAELTELVRAAADEHGYRSSTWQALAWCGPAGHAALRAAIVYRRTANGAAAALHRVAPELAAPAVRERLARGLHVVRPDHVVLRDLTPDDVELLRAARRRNPASVSAAQVLGWTAARSALADLTEALGAGDAVHRGAAVLGLAACLGVELDDAGVSALLSIAVHDQDRRVRVAARSELVQLGLEVPWVRQAVEAVHDELYRDETAPDLDDLDALAARLTDVGPSTNTVLHMLQLDPGLIQGPVRPALSQLMLRAVDGVLEPELIRLVAVLAGEQFVSAAADRLDGTVPLPVANLRRLAWGLVHARPVDPEVFAAIATCARVTSDPAMEVALRAHDLPAEEKVRHLLGCLLALREPDREVVAVWSGTLRHALVRLAPQSRAEFQGECARATRHALARYEDGLAEALPAAP